MNLLSALNRQFIPMGDLICVLLPVLLLFCWPAPPRPPAPTRWLRCPCPRSCAWKSAGPRGKVWNRLSPKEKKLAYYLTQAADAGRDLLFYRNHRHALTIKRVLETALDTDHLPVTKQLLGDQPFAELVVYAAKFLDQAGPYSASNRKYILQKVTPDQIRQLLTRYAPKLGDNGRNEIARLLTDPSYEVQQYPENPDGTGLEKTGNNYYQKGITAAEVARALTQGLEPSLNSRVVRKGDGLVCETQTVRSPGVVGDRLRKVVTALEAARPYACTPHQKSQIDHLVKYFREGNVEEFRKMNIDWVRDRSHSPVDFMLGWVEFYGDYRAQMASWESYVQIVDPEISKKAQALAGNCAVFRGPHAVREISQALPHRLFAARDHGLLLPGDQPDPHRRLQFAQLR